MMKDTQVAKGLGWFSIGLGATELLAPRFLGKATGVGPKTRTLRLFGARELASGIAVLSQRKPKGPLWGRFAGDLMDIAFFGKALKSSSRKGRVAFSLAMILGVTFLDLAYAQRL